MVKNKLDIKTGIILVIFVLIVILISQGNVLNNKNIVLENIGYPFPHYFSHVPSQDEAGIYLIALEEMNAEYCEDVSNPDECRDLILKKEAFAFNDRGTCNVFDGEDYDECILGINAYNAYVNKDVSYCEEGVSSLSLIEFCKTDVRILI